MLQYITLYYTTVLKRVQVPLKMSTITVCKDIWTVGYLYRIVRNQFDKLYIVLCILTRPAGTSKYCRTRKNIQRYCTPIHPIGCVFYHLFGADEARIIQLGNHV